MKLLIFFLLVGFSASAQTYIIRGDSVKLQKIGANSELIIENGTRNTTGVLVNYGNGRTRFSKPRIVGDTLFIGVDTILGVGAAGASWNLTGNSGTNPASNFIGTTDSVNFKGVINNVQGWLLNINQKNTSFGQESGLVFNAGGIRNSTFGYRAAFSNTSGDDNVAIGHSAMLLSPTGSRNISIGSNTLSVTTLSNSDNIAIGHNALRNTTVSSLLGIGSSALLSNTTGASNLAVGHSALSNNTTGNFNIAIGSLVLAANTTSSYNIGIGVNVLNGNTSGDLNTATGYNSMIGSSSAYSNAAYGANNMTALTTGFQNASFGAGGMENATTAQENAGLGYDNGLNATTGIRNVWIGWNAKSGTDGSNNIMVGYRTGASLTAGNANNVFIGSQAGDNASQKVDATNSIAIGQGTYTTANNQIILGNASITTVGIGTFSPSYNLHVNGTGFFDAKLTVDDAIEPLNDNASPLGAIGKRFSTVYSGQITNSSSIDFTASSSVLNWGANGSLTMPDVSAPSTPSSGKGALYVNGDSLRFKNDAGTEFTLGAGGSGGGPTLYTGDGTIDASGTFGIRTIGLSNLLQFQRTSDGRNFFKISSEVEAEQVVINTYNATGLGNETEVDVYSNASSSRFLLRSGYNDGEKLSRIIGFADATTSTLTYTADTHTFNGNVTINGTLSGMSSAYNNQTGTTYTLDAADNGKIVTIDNGSAITLTVPAGLPAGFNCTIVQLGAGLITVTPSSTTVNNTDSFTQSGGQFSAFTILQYASDTFLTQGKMQ